MNRESDADFLDEMDEMALEGERLSQDLMSEVDRLTTQVKRLRKDLRSLFFALEARTEERDEARAVLKKAVGMINSLNGFALDLGFFGKPNFEAQLFAGEYEAQQARLEMKREASGD